MGAVRGQQLHWGLPSTVSYTVDTGCAGRSLGGTASKVWEASARAARGVCSSEAEAEFAEGQVHRVVHLVGLQGSYVQDGQLRIAVCELGVCLVDPLQVRPLFGRGCALVAERSRLASA
jgi:hypothetical protein